MPQPVPVCFAPKYPPPADNLVDARIFVGQKFVLGHTWLNNSDDFVASIAGHRAARIMLERRSGPTSVWCWYITGPHLPQHLGPAQGVCEDFDQAKSEMRRKFDAWLDWGLTQKGLANWHGANSREIGLAKTPR